MKTGGLKEINNIDYRSIETVDAGPNDASLENDPDLFLDRMVASGAQECVVGGRVLRPGSRVRLNPRPRGDIVDMALAGRLAVIEGIDEDDAGASHVAVTLEDFSGWDLGGARHPALRFFFDPSELEAIENEEKAAPQRRILVAGIGNIFCGDDGFGAEVAGRLMKQSLPPGIDVGDFGIRGMDLVYALGRPYHAAILIDAVPLGRPPGTIYVIEPDEYNGKPAGVDPHRMDPLSVLGMAGRFGQLPGQILIVGCEPETIGEGENPEQFSMGLSAPVAAAVNEAVEMVMKMACRLLSGHSTTGSK